MGRLGCIVVAVVVAGCATQGTRHRRKEKIDPFSARARYRDVREVTHSSRPSKDVPSQEVRIEFGVVEEGPIPGFAPRRGPAVHAEYGTSSVPALRAKASGVVTLVLVYEGKDVARYEHVDASAPIYVTGFPGSYKVFIPHVSQTGEPQTIVYEYDPRVGPDLRQPKQPIQRVVRALMWKMPDDKNLRTDGTVFFAFLGSENGRPLANPVDMNGDIVPLPEGVIGVVPLGAPYWSGWLVRWNGARGEGWSFTSSVDLQTMKDQGPRWKRFGVTRERGYNLVFGELDDGRCEAKTWQAATRAEAMYGSAPKVTCDDAVKTVLALQESAVERKEQQATAKREALLKKTLATPEGFAAYYQELIWTERTTEACTRVSAKREPEHVDFVLARMNHASFSATELDCALARRDLTAAHRQKLETALAEREERAKVAERQKWSGTAAPGYSGSGGGGSFVPAGGSSQSHADYMKAVNDYMYGSGKSSLCPFNQGGYCN